MIIPELQDWWTAKRLTAIGMNGSCFSGAGVPLNVILHAFLESDYVWFSTIYGEFDDNVLIAALDRNTASNFKLIEYETKPLMRTEQDEKLVFEEYSLTEEIKAELGLSFEHNNYSLINKNMAKYLVYSHDNCFFCVEPVDRVILSDLVLCVLRQHSFYLGCDVDWAGVLEKIVERVSLFEKTEIRSNPSQKCLMISKYMESRPLLQRLLKPHSFCNVNIEDGKATLTKSIQS